MLFIILSFLQEIALYPSKKPPSLPCPLPILQNCWPNYAIRKLFNFLQLCLVISRILLPLYCKTSVFDWMIVFLWFLFYGESNDLTVKWVWVHKMVFPSFKVLVSFCVCQSLFFHKQLKRIINFCQLCLLYLLNWSSQIVTWVPNMNISIVMYKHQTPSNPDKYNSTGGRNARIWNKRKYLNINEDWQWHEFYFSVSK